MTVLKVFLSQLVLVVCVILSNTSWAQSTTPIISDSIIEGTRLNNYEAELKRVYPLSTRVEEYSFVPVKWGGISLMGLIGRLVGDRAHTFESMNTRRYIYRAYQDTNVIGISHGSSIETQPNQPIDLFVFYNTDSSIRDVRLDRAPTSVYDSLQQGGYLQQFLNRPTEDFTVTIGKRGVVKDWGAFSKQARRPKDKTLATYFDKILRSMRFNAAVVEVTYFIGQHPQGLQAQSIKIQ